VAVASTSHLRPQVLACFAWQLCKDGVLLLFNGNHYFKKINQK
jgi:sulfur transfer complex TusBCD TusB component (DsrH family)